MAALANAAIATCLSLTGAIGRSRTLEEIYGAALDALGQGLELERSSILLFDADGVMRFKAWRGISQGYRQAVEGHTPWTPESPDPQPITVPDVREDAELTAYLPTFAAERIRALAFIPLVADARVIGKFMLYYGEPRARGAEELELAGVIAAQVAFAVARTRAEQARLAAANEASRLKDEFLAVLSHELRSPLNAIVGWVHLLESGGLGAERLQEAIGIIGRNARLQAKLIEDILDVSRIAAGKFELERRPLLIGALARAAANALQPAALERGIEIATEIAEGLPPVEGDARRLQQVLANLLSNAVKFTARGGRVALRCYARGQDVFVEVRDTGIGIEPAFLPLVFERFSQADSRATRRYGGLGLGLAIARHLVEAHGGSIAAASGGRGCGAVFTVRLPAATADSVLVETWPGRLRRASAARRTLAGLRVLVVDDDADGRRLVAQLVTDSGAEAVSAASAGEALELLGRGRFDVMVADIAMPEVDGYQLVREAKVGRPGLLAVAVTALARPEDRARAFESGFDAYEAKPFEPAGLLAAIAELRSGQAGPRTPAH